MQKFILWALPAGQTDRLHERPLTSFPITAAHANAVEMAAGRDGWHGFRRVLDTNDAPNFAGAVSLSTVEGR